MDALRGAVRGVSAVGGPRAATVDEVMSRDVVTLELEVSLREALQVLCAESVSGAPVVEGHAVVGIVSVTDILELAESTPGVPASRPSDNERSDYEAPDGWQEGLDSPAEYFADFWSDAGAQVTTRFAESRSPEWDVLTERTVAEVVTRAVVSTRPGAPLREAARLMRDAEVHRILVMEDGELRGIVSASDIVRAVAEGRI